MKKLLVVLATATMLGTPALADIPAYKDCMKKTLGGFLGNVIVPDLKGMVDSVDARAGCRALLTEEEAAQLYNENKGWYDLFRKGGPLDPTTRGYSQRI